MKKFAILLIGFAFLISACKESDKVEIPPKDILIKSNQAQLKVKDAKFNVRYTYKTKKENFSTTLKVYMKRSNVNELPYSAKIEYDDGVVTFYYNNEYKMLDPKTKKITVAGKETSPAQFVVGNWISEAMDMFINNNDMTNSIKDDKDTVTALKIIKIGDRTTYLLRKNKFYQEYLVDYINYRNYDKETFLPLKDSTYQIMNQDTMLTVTEITNLELDKGISDDIFEIKVPQGYIVEDYKPQTQPEPLKLDSQAPEFTLNDGTGKPVSLTSLKGKVVILDFWGTWCVWCVKAMPKIQKVAEYFKGKKVEVMGISCQEPDGADPVKFMKDKNLTYNTLLKGDEVSQKFGVTGFPTLYVLDKQGKIIHIGVGYSDTLDTQLINIIKKQI
jgi:peroxiredoxin/outer membrane lipoprotein-sorting protein